MYYMSNRILRHSYIYFSHIPSPLRILHMTRAVHTFNRTGHFPFKIFPLYFNFNLHIYLAYSLGKKRKAWMSDRFHFMILYEPLRLRFCHTEAEIYSSMLCSKKDHDAFCNIQSCGPHPKLCRLGLYPISLKHNHY